MDNSPSSSSNTNDNSKPSAPTASVDGFSRPAQSSPVGDSSAPSSNSSSDSSADAQSSTPSDDKGNSTPQTAEPALSAPVTSGSVDQKRSKIWTIVLVLLILVVFAGGLYGVYAYQQNKINKLNAQVSSQNQEIASLKSQVNQLQSASSTTSSSTQPTFKISELGVAFTVPNNLADLNYVLNSSHTTANVSTQNLATLEASCAASPATAPLGSITKVSGNYTSSTTMTLIKQYSGYYIAYIKSPSSCSTDTKVTNLVNSLTNDFKGSFSSIQQISG